MFKQPSPRFETPIPPAGGNAAVVEAVLPPPSAGETLQANPVTSVTGEVALSGASPQSVPEGRFQTLREFWNRTTDVAVAAYDTVRDPVVQEGFRAIGETVVTGVMLAGRVSEASKASKAGKPVNQARATENRALLGHAAKQAPGNWRATVAGAKAARTTFRKSYANRKTERAERQVLGT